MQQLIAGNSTPNAEQNVGAGLLANAVYQSCMYRLTLRIREQARSHIFIAFQLTEGVYAQRLAAGASAASRN